jgi:hypothetical protein
MGKQLQRNLCPGLLSHFWKQQEYSVMMLLALKRHMTVLILFVSLGFGSTDTNGLPAKCLCGIFLAIPVISKCLVRLKD